MQAQILLFAAAAMLAACSHQPAQNPFSVKYALEKGSELNGKTAYLINFDSGEKLDSATVAGDSLAFTGVVEAPLAARLMIDGKRGPMFILEGGDITFTADRQAQGTPLNDMSAKINAKLAAIAQEYQQVEASDTTDAASARLEALEARYKAVNDSAMNANIDNPVGLVMFLSSAYEMTPDEFTDFVTKHPVLATYERVKSLQKAFTAKANTSEGKKYVDFEVKNDSTSEHLSDYVGKTPVTLVDFFASWCGPCMREVENIKELLKEYGDKGLSVVGVAVWDKPEDTLEAVKAHEITWPVMLNTQNVATDLYGIPAIPCILLIDQQGTILSRDKMGTDLRQAVEAALTTPDSEVAQE